MTPLLDLLFFRRHGAAHRCRRVAARATLAAALIAGADVYATSVPVTAPLSRCAQLAPLPQPPAYARTVQEFGAIADDERDDTEAIQRALDALKPNEWLVFPPGRYLHARRLRVTVAGAKLWGERAQLDASDPRDAAVMLMADGASLYNFTLTGAARERGSQPHQSRVAIFPRSDDASPLESNEVRGNRIVAAAGDDAAGSAMSAGIFVYRARGFLVADNVVDRTLADGIHVTAGSSQGRVVRNVVRDTGDDMIAIVSYLGRRGEDARAIAADLEARLARRLVRDVVIEGNSLAGQYWGRGIAVVGGRNVTIRANGISDTTTGAAIYVAREAGYTTAGVQNIVIEGNDARRVQVSDPRFVGGGAPLLRRRTGHGAIEIFAQIDADEARIPALAQALAIRGVRIERNVIEDAAGDGIRVHAARGNDLAIEDVRLLDNRVARVRGKAVREDRPGAGKGGAAISGAALGCLNAK